MASGRKFTVINGGQGEVITPRQLSFFDDGRQTPHKPKEPKPLELIVTFEPVKPINLVKCYGVTFDELASFQSKPTDWERVENYYGIQKTWYGLNNMESRDGRFGVPHEMLVRMKPFESVALYLGVAQVKMDDAVSGGQNDRYDRMKETSETEFGKLVNELVRIADQFHGMKVMMNKKSNRIDALPLKMRMQSVSSAAKDKFMNSLRLTYRNPIKNEEGTSKTKNYPYEFLEPHPENKPDHTGIEIYRRHIADFMKVIYSQNIWRH